MGREITHSAGLLSEILAYIIAAAVGMHPFFAFRAFTTRSFHEDHA
jgi:hypothetical protein